MPRLSMSKAGKMKSRKLSAGSAFFRGSCRSLAVSARVAFWGILGGAAEAVAAARVSSSARSPSSASSFRSAAV
eukprot:11551250-Prorocentrum_lima.AAC.1